MREGQFGTEIQPVDSSSSWGPMGGTRASKREEHLLLLKRHQGLAAGPFIGLWILFSDRNQLFSTSSGARKDASKILIVITDGQKQGDYLNYEDVIPMAEAAGIIRYAVGVRCGHVLPPLPPLLPLKATSLSRTKPPALSASTTFRTKAVFQSGGPDPFPQTP